MAKRCGCYREGDATVFGEVHECSVSPKPPADLPRFVPSSRFVVPDMPVKRCTPPTSEGTYDPDLQEARIHQVLSPDELED